MKSFLVCPPLFFNVTYTINPWMDGNINKVDTTKANEQWNKLVERLDNKISIIQPDISCPDMVFTANAGFVSGDKFILSNFSKQERKAEEYFFQKWFEDRGYYVYKVINNYEGEGDHLVDAYGRHWLGTGYRTDKKVVKELENILETEVNYLELVDSKFYHLDTCFCPLPNGELLWYPEAFSVYSQQAIQECFPVRIEVDLIDALRFCCNAIPIEDIVILPKNTYASLNLNTFGYKVEELDLSEFMKAGGAAKCLVLNLGLN